MKHPLFKAANIAAAVLALSVLVLSACAGDTEPSVSGGSKDAADAESIALAAE